MGKNNKSSDRDLILDSAFFDGDFYRNKYTLSIDDTGKLADHYLDNYDKFPQTSALFSGATYLALNPDLVGVKGPPLLHYIKRGSNRFRNAISVKDVKAVFEAADMGAIEQVGALLPADTPIRVLFTKAGNFFFEDIARYIAQALARLGWQAQAMSDLDPCEPAQGWFDLVTAPHEYMIIGKGRDWSQERVAQAAYFNTEQWQTIWFASCLGFLRRSGRVIDINPTSAASLRALGIRGAFLPLMPLDGTPFEQKRATFSRGFTRRKYVEGLRYPQTLAERQYDILFVANLNERRQKVMASLAPTLARFKTFLHCPISNTPVRPGDGDMLSSRDFTQLALNSKILLNIHRDEIGYFEWHRLFLYGIANNTVVLTEPSFVPPGLIPGIHYIEASIENMPRVIEQLLGTPQGAERLRTVSAACSELLGRMRPDGTIEP